MVWGIIAAIIAVATSAASYMQAKKAEKLAAKQAEEMAAVQISGHNNNRSLYTVYGKALVGSTVVWKKLSGKRVQLPATNFLVKSAASGSDLTSQDSGTPKRYLYRAVTLCNGPVEDVTEVLVDGESYLSARFRQEHNRHFGTAISKGPTTGLYYNRLKNYSATDFAQWDSTKLGKGVAYAMERLYLDKDKPAFQGEPSTQYIVKGRLLYDPRLDSTVTGGSGSHRSANSATWAYSDNPVLALLDYVTNAEYGRGLAHTDIDLASMITCANACDVLVDIPARLINEENGFIIWINGEAIVLPADFVFPQYRDEQLTTNKQKRYRINVAIDGSKEILDNIQQILNVFKGNLIYVNGKYKCVMADVASSVLSITDDDIIGGLTISDGDRSQRMNRATIKFTNENKDYKVDQVSWPEIGTSEYNAYLAEDQNEKLHRTFTIDGCTDYYQAEDTAEFIVREGRSGLTVSGTFGSRALALTPGDVVAITYDSASYSGKYFRVQTVALNIQTMNVNLTLREYDSSVYTWNPNKGNEPLGFSWHEEPVNLSPTSPSIGTISTATHDQADTTAVIVMTVPFTGVPTDAHRVEVSASVQNENKFTTVNVTDLPTETSAAITLGRGGVTYDVRVRYIIVDANGTHLPSAFVRTTHAVPALASAIGTKVGGISDGATANIIYRQDAPPTGTDHNAGDQWFDTNDGNKVYVWSGSTWVSVQDELVVGAVQPGDTNVNLGVRVGSGSSVFTIDSSGVYLGSETFSAAPFKVSPDGAATASKLTISGTTPTIAIGTDTTDTVTLSTASDHRMWVGSSTPESAKFKIHKDGTLTAKGMHLQDGSASAYFGDDGFTDLAYSQIATNIQSRVNVFETSGNYNLTGTGLNALKVNLTTSSSLTITVKASNLFSGLSTGSVLGGSAASVADAIADIPDNFTLALQKSTTSGTSGFSNLVTQTFTKVTSGSTSSTTYLVESTAYVPPGTTNFATQAEVNITNYASVSNLNADGDRVFENTSTYATGAVYFRVLLSTTDTSYDSTLNNIMNNWPRVLSIKDNGATGFTVVNDDPNNREITQAAGTGDITSVVAGTNLNGGATSGVATLNLDSTITGDHTFEDNLVIEGNLTVQGTTTTVDTDDLNVKDKNITLNYSTGDSSANANGAGITIQDAVNSTTNATILWDSTNDEFDFSHGITSAGNIVAGTSTNYLQAKSLRLGNGELSDTDFAYAYQLIVDANDSSSNMSNKGDFTGGYPYGIYMLGDGGLTTKTLGSGLVGIWNTTNFTKLHVDYLVGLKDSGVTAVEYDYLDGVTSSIQTQLDARLPLSGGTLTGGLSGTTASFSGNIETTLDMKARILYSSATNNTYLDLGSDSVSADLNASSAVNLAIGGATIFQARSTGVLINSGGLMMGGSLTEVIDSSRNASFVDATLTGDLTIPNKIIHAGDTNNYLSFGTDTFGIVNGGTTVLSTNATDINAVRTLDLDPADNTSAINARVDVTSTGIDATKRAIYVDMNISGATTLTGDRGMYGLQIDLDSSSTGGDTSNEQRLYGAYVQATNKGDADLVYGGYFMGQNNGTQAGTLTNTTNLVGVYGLADQNRSKLVSAMYGVRGQSTVDNAGATGTVNATNSYGVHGLHNQSTGGTGGTTTNANGVYGEVQCDEGVVTNAYGVRSVIDHNAGTIGTGYLFYGAFTGTIGTKWGIVTTGASYNKISGTFRSDDGVESNPTYSFNSDTNTGMYSVSDNVIGFSTNGSPRLKIENTGIEVLGSVSVTGSASFSSTLSSGNITAGLIGAGGAPVTGYALYARGSISQDSGSISAFGNLTAGMGFVKAASGGSGGYYVASQQVIDGSRNLTNIGTISSGAITATAITATADTNALSINTITNGTGAEIKFSDHSSQAQQGFITYHHSDSAAYGGSDVFTLGTDQTALRVLADGLLMFKSGLALKPASGTGAGTTLITSGRALQNITTISSGAITSTGTVTATGGNSDEWNTGYDYSQIGHVKLDGTSIISGSSASTGTRTAMVWMRGKVGDSVNQINVRGADIEFGQGGTLDATPAFKFGHTGILTATGQINASGGNSAQWNTAYGWGNPSGVYLPLAGGTLTGGLSGTTGTFTGKVQSTSLRIASGGYTADIQEGEEYKYYLVGVGLYDGLWKKVCDVAVGSGLYKALTMKVTLESQGSNFGSSTLVTSSEFIAVYYRSAGTQDDQNKASIHGENSDYHELRVIKTATGAYELQIKMISNYKDAFVKIEVLSTNGGTVTIPSSITNGSTSGTVYSPSVTTNVKKIYNEVKAGFVVSDSYKVGSQEVITSGRALTNIAGITTSSGSITSYGSVKAGQGGIYTNAVERITNAGNLTNIGTITSRNITVSIPDSGGSPAMTALLNLYGFEGRGAGIKIRDKANSASGSSNREWFIGSGYNQNGFNIGYSSTGSQSSYSAQNKLSIDTSGNVAVLGTITSPKLISPDTTDSYLDLQGTASVFLNAASAVNLTVGTATIFQARSTGVLINSGGLMMGGSLTTVIDSSRNMSNIGTISSGAITSSGSLNFTANPATIQNAQDNSGQIIISAKNSSGTAKLVRWDVANDANGAWRPDVTAVSSLGLTNRIWNTLYINTIKIGSSNDTFVDSSRNITAGTISSGAITSTGIITSADFFKATGQNIKFSAGGTHVLNMDVNRKIYPATNNSTDLGSSGTLAFRTLYLTSGIYHNTSQILDSSRNLLNIGTISSGAITSTGITLSTTYPKLQLNDTTGVDRNFSVGTNNETFTIRNETAGSDSFTIYNDNNATFAGTINSGAITSTSSMNAAGGYYVSGTEVVDASRNLTNIGTINSGALTIDVDNQSGGALRIEANQTNPNQDFYFAQEIVSTLSGSTTATADREQGGIWIDMNSSATGGDTSNEHRAYGVYADVDSTGDADLVVGGYFNATATPTTGTTSSVMGGYFYGEDNGGAGQVSNVYGIHSLAVSDNSTSDTNALYGVYAKAYNTADSGSIGQVNAVYGEIEIPSGSADIYGNSKVFNAQYDNNGTVAQTNNTYLFYGNYSGVLPTSAYGLFIADAVTSHFGGGNLTGVGNLTSSGNISTTGDFKIGSTTVIDSSRNLENIGTITGTGRLYINQPSTETNNELIIMRANDVYADQIWADNSGSIRLRTQNGRFDVFTGGAADSISASGSVTRLSINAAGNTTFGGTISSGAITAAGAITNTSGSITSYGSIKAGQGGVYTNSVERITNAGNLTNIGTISSGAITSSGTGSFAEKVTISNADYANHLELVRGSDTLYITPSGGQLLTNGGLSPATNNAYDLGRSDKYWQDLWLSNSLKMGGTTVINASKEIKNVPRIFFNGGLQAVDLNNSDSLIFDTPDGHSALLLSGGTMDTNYHSNTTHFFRGTDLLDFHAQIDTDGISSFGNFKIGSTTVIDASRGLTDITGLDMTASTTADIHLSRSSFITFYNNSNRQHGIGSRNAAGSASDDIRINSYGAVYVNLDSNSNNSSSADFVIGRHGSATGTITELARISGEDGDITTTGGINVGDAKAVGHGAISLKYDLVYMTAGVISPCNSAGTDSDNAIDLGKSTARFNDIFATNGTIQTSDRKEKQDIDSLSDAEERVAVAAKGLLKKFRWKSAVEDKGDDARIHFGIIAQDLQDAFKAEGLDAGRYGMFTSNTWTNEDGEEQTRMGVRYSELLAFIISAI